MYANQPRSCRRNALDVCESTCMRNSAESGLCQVTNASMKKIVFIFLSYTFYDLGKDVAILIDEQEF